LEDVPIPEPGPGEVLVKVAFCGISHSDLSLINGTFPAQVPVVTQGHEASGTIAKLGPDVTGWTEGDRVIAAAGRPCWTCPNCRRGDIVNCLRLQLMAFAYDGAWAEYTVALAAGLTRVPDNVPLEQAAILADAVSTPSGPWCGPAKSRSANPSGCGASAAWAPTSSSSHGWSVRYR
jgi:D-arabinose 1-dehydrogenase-like Zn-dependent alcohol dehydrogenase